ncbi:hypothetical protein A0256_15385 [Mucilaginibacter sp. PAMC 26640]|nr:hypothetical protein A0256_15385 [Mucilaginibacter sp. PAMC 26640]
MKTLIIVLFCGSACFTNALALQVDSLNETNVKSEILDIKARDILAPGTKAKIIRVDYKISILISNPKGFLQQRPTDQTKLILYADGLPLKGMTTPYFEEIRQQDINDKSKIWPDKLWVPFIFKRDSTNKNAWNNLFRLAHWNESQIKIGLSLGWQGMYPLGYGTKSTISDIIVCFYEPRIFWIVLATYFAFTFYFIYLCSSTGLIRDPDRINATLGPFSLAQTQLAFWTVIILGGFIYLVLLTGLSDSLNQSSLVLLGISGGTTGVAGFIDFYKKQEQTKAQMTNAVLPSTATFLKKHRSFLLDIVSDGINISVQRAQILLWNLVLGAYFIWYIISNKSMPVFSDTLLLLAGVSSALYLTSKGPENPRIPMEADIKNTTNTGNEAKG